MDITNNKPKRGLLFGALLALANGVWVNPAWSYGTGSDGAFEPQVSTQLQLPPDGIFNFTSVSIPAGVEITFVKNTANTPVTFLATGDVLIDGTINLNGTDSADVGAAGDGNLGDDGLPGVGGPGGFNGGRGGIPSNILGGTGLGPGGGEPAKGKEGSLGCGGGGAGFILVGNASEALDFARSDVCDIDDRANGGPTYSGESLLPLIGGSGGGGASSGDFFGGSGGGGGGGAILIASATKITLNGTISAKGGNSGDASGLNHGGTGGAGSGGAIRIVAETLDGNGALRVAGGETGASNTSSGQNGGRASVGRIRLEANNMLRTATEPVFSFSAPEEIFVVGLPALRIVSVAGVTAPEVPTGNADIVLPETTQNPINIEIATTGVPAGNVVKLVAAPAFGPAVEVFSPALAGSEASASTSVAIELPSGPSVLSAEVSFTVTVAMNEEFNLQRFVKKGETVESMTLSQHAEKGALTTLHTKEGNQYTWPSHLLAMQ